MVVYFCTDCGKRKRNQKTLSRALPKRTELVPVGCQKVCKGPVVGAAVEGSLEWFRGMDSGKAIAALNCAITTGWVDKQLTSRRVKNRSGKRR